MRAFTFISTRPWLWGLALPLSLQAQVAPMASLPTADALVNGQVQVSGSTAALLSNVSVTVYDHATPVTLNRGGQLLVCSTSEFHLLRSTPAPALVVGLDRGALEWHAATQGGDILLTPDLKFVPETKGQYDLRVRVTREGDTCVDNAGAGAPVLSATDAFTTATYRILPGQHLLFVKGDLHQVVDHERSPCGCPGSGPALVAGRAGTPAQQAAAAAHPFPEAQSEGLAATPTPTNEAAVGTASSQVSTSFSYGPGATPPPGSTGVTGLSAPPSFDQPAEEHGFFHAIGRFFHHLFHGGQ